MCVRGERVDKVVFREIKRVRVFEDIDFIYFLFLCYGGFDCFRDLRSFLKFRVNKRDNVCESVCI